MSTGWKSCNCRLDNWVSWVELCICMWNLMSIFTWKTAESQTVNTEFASNVRSLLNSPWARQAIHVIPCAGGALLKMEGRQVRGIVFAHNYIKEGRTSGQGKMKTCLLQPTSISSASSSAQFCTYHSPSFMKCIAWYPPPSSLLSAPSVPSCPMAIKTFVEFRCFRSLRQASL